MQRHNVASTCRRLYKRHVPAGKYLIFVKERFQLCLSTNPYSDEDEIQDTVLSQKRKWGNGIITRTVDSRYLEFQGTLWNTSRYPYLDISDLQNWGKIIRTTTFNKYVCNWTLEVRDILKILWKRGEIAPYDQFLLFFTILFYLLLDFHV